MTKGVTGIVLVVVAAATVWYGSFSVAGRGSAAFAPISSFLAQVGVSLGVAPNPYNTLNEQLNQKQIQINEEQADLAAREAALASSTAAAAATAGPASSPLFGYFMIVVGILEFFVGLNLYIDWRRVAKAPVPSVGVPGA